jgi:hypothetical protein
MTKSEDLYQTLRYLVLAEGDEDYLADAIEIAMSRDSAATPKAIERLFFFLQEGG